MCITFFPADLTETYLGIFPTKHPDTGRPIHVLTYQNTVANRSSSGGNAMILHFPADQMMTEKNIIDTQPFGEFLYSWRLAILPKPRTRSMGGVPAIVFDHDVYTIVLSSSVDAVQEALDRVAPERRPALNPAVLDWYADHLSGWTFALCCFNNRDASAARPMMWWYVPFKDLDGFTLPAIDSHQGEAPNLNSHVETDHWVFFGADKPVTPNFGEVHYDPPAAGQGSKMVHQDLRQHPFLPAYVIGQPFRGQYPNKDFVITWDDIKAEKGFRRSTRFLRNR